MFGTLQVKHPKQSACTVNGGEVSDNVGAPDRNQDRFQPALQKVHSAHRGTSTLTPPLCSGSVK